MPYYSAGDYYQGDNYAAGGFPLIGAALALGKKFLPKIAGKALQLFKGKAPAVAAGAIAARGLVPRPARMPAFDETGFPMGRFGRSRRMNVTNVRALRRAGRRVKGFLKLARRLGALPVSSSGKKLFKAPKRKKVC